MKRDTLTLPGRLELRQRPSPIHSLPRLSEQLGVDLHCMRDDLTGVAFGGNKIRKLEFLLHEAHQRGADSIVTCGSGQSNWCLMAAVAGSMVGLDCHLVLGGGRPSEFTANLRLDEIAGAGLHFEATTDDGELEVAAGDLSRNLNEAGRHSVQIPMGGSNGLGTFGYVTAFDEIVDHERQCGRQFDTIVFASGSGGTHAGLAAGQHLHGWKGRVLGMTVSRSAAEQRDRVRRILSEFDTLAGTDTATSARFDADDRYVGGGYRQVTDGCREAIGLFARSEGLFLDEVYTGKAAAGLVDYCRSGRFTAGQRVLFVHTGGAVQLLE